MHAEQFARELDQVFEAHDSMATEVVIDGMSMLAIVEQVQAEEVEGVGVTVENQRLLLRESDIAVPKVGQVLEINGERWTCADTTVLAGVLDLQLFRDVS